MEVVHEECFEKSHLWEKCKLILLIYYKYIAGIRNIDNKIYYAKLFTPPQQDLLIIKNDYYFIVEKIRQGHAHELSESDTLYLGAAPKAAKNTDFPLYRFILFVTYCSKFVVGVFVIFSYVCFPGTM